MRFLACLLLVVAACGTAMTHPEAPDDKTTKQQEILELSGKILEWRREAGLGPTVKSGNFSMFYNQPGTKVADPMAEIPDTCTDVCTLGDYICQAADDVCRIAGELPGDDWARRKCATAKASCVEARERCTGCVARPPAQ